MTIAETNQGARKDEVIVVLNRSYKDKTEELRIALSEYEGNQFVSMRVFWQNSSGEWLPGKSGVSIRKKELEAVIDALSTVAAKLADSSGRVR